VTGAQLLQLAASLALLLVLARPLGAWVARALGPAAGEATPRLGRVEALIYRVAGVDPTRGMDAMTYARALLVLHALGLAFTLAIQLLQAQLPLNPAGLPAVPPLVALNTAVSFVTNTNWQAYAGETTMSHLTQMLALGSQSFVSAATGLAVLAALVRGLARRETDDLGNFWVDLVRGTLRVLLPASIVLALVLVTQGVPQTLEGARTVPLLDAAAGRAEQVLALGPVASQVAIKQLGTNGGGFYNANSAHPLENPTQLSNLLQWLAILALPAAACFSFGDWVRDRRQGHTLLAAMLALLLPAIALTTWAEQAGNPALSALGVDASLGNMEGKEARFGVGASALWAAATTAASNGSVNAMHDSFTPLGGLAPMVLMQLGEVVFGGVGSGLCGLLVFVLVTVFVSGLLVGRTPEYLGKKIEVFEMKMAALVVLSPSVALLVGSAIATQTVEGVASLGNPGAHGFSELLYAFSSGANNNGSAFGGLTASGPFYTLALAAVMLVGRFGVILPVLAIAGSLAQKKRVPPSGGTLPTHGPLFAGLLVGVVVLVGALTFVPALALGPVVEHLMVVGAAAPVGH
jgi:K+-transporting ATPase ATPase A chain